MFHYVYHFFVCRITALQQHGLYDLMVNDEKLSAAGYSVLFFVSLLLIKEMNLLALRTFNFKQLLFYDSFSYFQRAKPFSFVTYIVFSIAAVYGDKALL